MEKASKIKCNDIWSRRTDLDVLASVKIWSSIASKITELIYFFWSQINGSLNFTLENPEIKDITVRDEDILHPESIEIIAVVTESLTGMLFNVAFIEHWKTSNQRYI